MITRQILLSPRLMKKIYNSPFKSNQVNRIPHISMKELTFKMFIWAQIRIKWANKALKKLFQNWPDQEENKSLKEAQITHIRSLFRSLVDGFSKITHLSSSMLSSRNTRLLKAQELISLSYWLLSNLLWLSKNKKCFLHISKNKSQQKSPNIRGKLTTPRWKI